MSARTFSIGTSTDTNRIGVLIPTFHGGGAERAMLLFASGAADRGLAVDLLVCHPDGPLAETVDRRINVRGLGSNRIRGALFPLVRYLKENRPAALFTTIQHANMLAIAAQRLSRVPTKVVIRQSTSHLSEPKKNFVHAALISLIPWVYPYADGVIAVSEGVRDQLKQVNPSMNVHVLPNPVLQADFIERSNEPVDHPWFQHGGPPVIVAAGRLQPFKGFGSLLKAFAKLPRENGYRLVVLGEGPDRERLLSLARELGVSDRFDLPGFVLNPLPYMRRAGVFVLSSEYEGMPNVLLQAMACGTAVVSTDCKSGPREILENGELGQLVPVGDDDALASAIRQALANGPVSHAAERVRWRYSVSRAVEEYLNLAGIPSSTTLLQGVA
jgi:glycosyltransferase involved in cell wall biosynthesis